MRVEWYPAAEDDLDEIVRYIFQHNPVAAFELEDRIISAAQNLGLMPYMGKPGHAFGTREFVVHENYTIIYKIKDPELYITAIVHNRQLYPDGKKSAR